MAKVAYIERRFRAKAVADLVGQMSALCDDYLAQGLRLTVRQLYYQLVARNVIPNNVKAYKRIVSLATDGRLGGYIDWDAIEDRTREFMRRPRWAGGRDALEHAAETFHRDLWEGQPVRPFVVVEKEALAGVLWSACAPYDVPVFPSKGYSSVTVLRDFVLEDVNPRLNADPQQDVLVFHLSDHDPSGVDMTRDLDERLDVFTTHRIEVRRIALTMEQIEETGAPPNPAKQTDSRFGRYAEEHGDESWELDALPPRYLIDLLNEHIEPMIDEEQLERVKERTEIIRSRLRAKAALDWHEGE